MLLTFTAGVMLASLPFGGPHYVEAQRPGLSSMTLELPPPKPEVAPLSYPKAKSIRSIDFRDFTYPGSTYGEFQDYYPEETFTLRDGAWGGPEYGMTLMTVSYGDVTGDGREEAILTFDQETDGSAALSSVYVYTLKDHRPKLLWAFESGDRAEGGLRHAYASGGKLWVELYGKETRVEGGSATFSTEPSPGLCCPKFFTRTSYEWVDGRFQWSGGMEVLPEPTAER
jgi:hypothetical protein